MKVIEGGVTAPKGFQAAGIFAGIKKEKKDMAMVYSEVPCAVAGTFTTNVVKAAPVKWDQHVVYEVGQASAIVVNSGIANACTGEEGYGYCRETAAKTAELLHVSEDQILVASTGVIGRQLPMDKIKGGVEKMIPLLSDTKAAGTLAAESIMTTDTIKKEAAVEFTLGGKTVTIGGYEQGIRHDPSQYVYHAGFYHDRCGNLQRTASESVKLLIVKDTYNMISVDGDTSTNDTATSAGERTGRQSRRSQRKMKIMKAFVKALYQVNETLAKTMAGDGEGATALFECKVIHAKTKEDAVILSKSVITSSLTKAAIFGHDANWGRILCALGYSGAHF